MRSAEFDIVLDSNEFVISKTAVLSIAYNYNSDGQLVYKKISPVDAPSYEQFYENKEDGAVVLNSKYQFTKTLTHSKTDSFGRKVFDELQGENGTVTRQFSYHLGEKTDTHEIHEKNKSAPTTNLVKDIVFSDGRIISYEYDGEERITKVTDSVDGITEYTYDALGQLLTETKGETLVNSMTYDNYGNISSKNGVTYIYGDSQWKDKLTKVGDKTITYDAQGNPTNYLGHTLTWEKGRQLKSFDNISYTYNANGIRTSKIVNGVEHKYILDGTKIIAEIAPELVMQPMYNNEDEVCGIIYNEIPYYFVKNLQGDVIAITDHNGEVVARYSYDAWGVPTITCVSGCSIGNENPFRYRGYYYDTETNLYYLQSRYYDANIGRFVNGDEAIFSLIPYQNLSHNVFAYCSNEPNNNCDATGYAVPVATIAGIVLACGLLLSAFAVLANMISLPSFKDAWFSFCSAIGNGLAWVWQSLFNIRQAVQSWTLNTILSVRKAVTTYKAILLAHTKVVSKVKAARRNVYRFFEIWFDGIGVPIIGNTITRSQAVTRAKRGFNSITYYSSDALYVANSAGGARAMWHQRHGGAGFFNHYHINGHANSAHIFYVISG